MKVVLMYFYYKVSVNILLRHDEVVGVWCGVVWCSDSECNVNTDAS